MYAAWLLARSVASSPRAGPGDRCIARVVLTLILLLIPMHLINPYFANTGLAHPLWIMLGLVAAAAGQLRSRPTPHPSGDPVDAGRPQAHSSVPRQAVT
jgi:hypothetical protein